jgi:hypothetical protein
VKQHAVLGWVVGLSILAMAFGLVGCQKPTTTGGPQPTSPRAPEPGPVARGYASPDAALDALIQACRDQDVAAFKAILAKDREQLAAYETMAQADAKGNNPEAVEKAYKNILKLAAEETWAPGRYKRFPAEFEGDDKAFIICIGRHVGPGQLPDAYRRLEFRKIDGNWYHTGYKLLKPNEIDRTKYKWDGGPKDK